MDTKSIYLKQRNLLDKFRKLFKQTLYSVSCKKTISCKHIADNKALEAKNVCKAIHFDNTEVINILSR